MFLNIPSPTSPTAGTLSTSLAALSFLAGNLLKAFSTRLRNLELRLHLAETVGRCFMCGVTRIVWFGRCWPEANTEQHLWVSARRGGSQLG